MGDRGRTFARGAFARALSACVPAREREEESTCQQCVLLRRRLYARATFSALTRENVHTRARPIQPTQVTERTGSVRAMLCAMCLAPRNAFAAPPEDAVGGLVVCLSGSSDAQTSADTRALSGTKEATGACTWCFVEAVKEGCASWSEIMGFIRHRLKVRAWDRPWRKRRAHAGAPARARARANTPDTDTPSVRASDRRADRRWPRAGDQVQAGPPILRQSVRAWSAYALRGGLWAIGSVPHVLCLRQCAHLCTRAP